jgi:hypothetical protein
MGIYQRSTTDWRQDAVYTVMVWTALASGIYVP